jgi:hypothetical protein
VHDRRPGKGMGLVHHSDRGSQYLSIKYTERLAEAGIEPSVGSVGDSYDNALAETINGLFKAEVIHRRGPWRSFEAVEYATLEWVDWFNNRRLLEPIGNIPPAEAEANFYATLETEPMAAQPTKISLRQTRRGSRLCGVELFHDWRHSDPFALFEGRRRVLTINRKLKRNAQRAAPFAPVWHKSLMWQDFGANWASVRALPARLYADQPCCKDVAEQPEKREGRSSERPANVLYLLYYIGSGGRDRTYDQLINSRQPTL